MFGHAEAELRLCTDQSEHCSLGVPALDDPASTRHLMRSIRDSASPFLDSRGGGFDAVHVEIIGPDGIRHLPRLVHHAAEGRAVLAEQLINAQDRKSTSLNSSH